VLWLLLALLAVGACTTWESGPTPDDDAVDDDSDPADDDDSSPADDDDSSPADDDTGDDDADDDTTGVDADGDGYTVAGGDCDDSDAAVHPGMVEYCDDKDNDCDGQTDESPQDCTVTNGAAACVAGECVIESCDSGWFDSDEDYSTGCEVAEDGWETYGGDSCAQAVVQWPSLTDSPATLEAIEGNIAYDHFFPTPDEDWYLLDATDVAEAEGGCDPFDVDVYFSSNPGGLFRLEVYDTGCQLWSGPGEACGNDLTLFSWDASDECPCSYSNAEGHNACTDNSFTFVIRVFRITGGPDDTEYELSVGNG